MTVRDTLAAITSDLTNAIKYDIARLKIPRDPTDPEKPTLLDFVLEDLARCELPPDPTKRFDEEQYHEVTKALELFVDIFFVPIMITPDTQIGMTTVMTWFELWEAQFRHFHQAFSEPNFSEDTLDDVESLVEFLPRSRATSGSVNVPSPDGDATLTYERTPTGWSSSLTSPNGDNWGFPHKLCLLTMDLPPGKYTHPVSIHDMLKEPRTYQLRPNSGRNYYERGSGSTWWPIS